MPDSPTPDARGLEALEEGWRRDPRTASLYALATRYLESGRMADAYDVLRRGLEVHQAHAAARELLTRVTAAMDSARGSRPGQPAIARLKVKSSAVRTPVEERVSKRVADRRGGDAPAAKGGRAKPPPGNPVAGEPGARFPPPAGAPPPRPPPMTREDVQVVLERKKGATTLSPRRGLTIAAIVLLLIGAAVAAYLVFQPL